MTAAKRTAEVRLLVIATVNRDDPELRQALATRRGRPVSIAEAVSSEVASNLESVSYIESVTVQPS